MKNDIYILTLGDFLNIDLLLLNWSIYIDRYTLLMSFVVSTVSLLVILYSVEYMAKDISKLKFFAYLNLFTFFMLVFISSGNFIQMFLG
jgi:NADH-quinone oxidoreductase subunit L